MKREKLRGWTPYQVRNFLAISRHIGLVAIAYSLLRAAPHDESLLQKLQRKLELSPRGQRSFLAQGHSGTVLVVVGLPHRSWPGSRPGTAWTDGSALGSGLLLIRLLMGSRRFALRNTRVSEGSPLSLLLSLLSQPLDAGWAGDAARLSSQQALGYLLLL